jgi:alpha-tubulin suppressor-like RCC1 family protein
MDAGGPVNDGTLNGVVAIDSSFGFSCALLSNGKLACWGMGEYGQLGDGFVVNRPRPITVYDVSGALSVSVNFDHSCAVMSDRRVRCWGKNSMGQLGTGDTTDSPVPMWVVNLSNVAAVSAGGAYNCALLTDHTLRCWGNGGSALGYSDYQSHPSPVVSTTINDATALSVNGASCALRADNTVSCWGPNNNYALGQKDISESRTALAVPGLANVVSLEAGLNGACVVLSDHTSRCWGADSWGQLGDGGPTDSYIPIDNGLTGVTSIAMGLTHACALHSDGTVSCWGSNGSGQLGNGTTSETGVARLAKVPGITGAVAISTGGAFTCALGADARVRCWGDNTVGQLGMGSTSTNNLSPVVVLAPAL